MDRKVRPFSAFAYPNIDKPKRNSSVERLLRSDLFDQDDTRRINEITETNLIHDRDQPLAHGDKFQMWDFVAAAIEKMDAKRPESVTSYPFSQFIAMHPATIYQSLRLRCKPHPARSCEIAFTLPYIS